MNKELIMNSDVLDIIFENRNKNYGAYVLRKFYNDRLRKAFGVMFLAVSGITAFTFLPSEKAYETGFINIKGPELGRIKKPEIKQPEIRPKTAVPVPKNVSTGKLVSNLIIVNNKDSSDKLNIDLDKLAIGSTTNISTDVNGPRVMVPVNDGDGKIPEPAKPLIDKTIPVFDAEIMPSFPGGLSALRKFLERNLNNPGQMEEGEEVNVKIRFVVGLDGKLQSFVTVEDGGAEFNKEVIRVLKKMPDWIPGKSNGENRSVYCVIPVKFVPAN